MKIMIDLKKGAKGSAVRVLQLFLQINDDGIFGAQTKKAVEDFQRANKLTITGTITKTEWKVIAKQLPTIRKGDKNRYVTMWQIILGISETGTFDEITYNSTRAFQAAANLTIDGIVGPKTWPKGVVEDFEIAVPTSANTEKKKNKKPVDNKQYDSRWGSVIYTQNNTYNKTQTIRNSGCGPSSMSDIVATWWNKNVTPKTLAALSVANGYRTKTSGTDWGFFKFCAKKYGASKFIQTTSIATLKESLQNGAYAIVSFRPSKWTKGGHFCCIWWWDGKQFYINDPASSSSHRAKGTEKEVKDAAKQYFIFFK